MKRFALLLVGLLSAQCLWASDLRMTSTLDVKVYERGQLYHAGTFPAGTEVRIDDNYSIGPSLFETSDGRYLHSKRGWIRVKRILNPHIFRRGSYAEESAQNINRNSDYQEFFVSAGVYDLSHDIRRLPRERVVVREEVYVEPAPIRREVYVEETFTNSYDVCYLQPRRHLVTMKEEQARRGRRNTAIGVGVGIAGIILGGSNNRDMRNLGTAMTIGGAVLATVGLVQWSDARTVVTTYDQRCDRYYTRDTVVRQVYIEGQRCSTERYYSRSWDREVEYFQTTCSGNRYYSFERNNQIW